MKKSKDIEETIATLIPYKYAVIIHETHEIMGIYDDYLKSFSIVTRINAAIGSDKYVLIPVTKSEYEKLAHENQ